MKTTICLLASMLTGIIAAKAQVYISDAYNNGSTAYDFSNAEIVTTAASGVGYVSSNSGQHYHFGPAAATLTVSGVYNAFNYTSFGTPATAGVDFFQGLDGNKGTTQEITGTVAPIFGILNIDNGANNFNLTNTAGANVGSAVNFTNGITTTVRTNYSNAALRLLDDATYSGTLNDSRHVNGYVGKIGNDAFTFPVGSGTDFRTLTISAPSSATNEYDVAWIGGDPSSQPDPSNGNALHSNMALGPGIQGISAVGQWDWIPVNGTGAGLTITASIPAIYNETVSNLRLVGWNGTQWVNLSTSGATPYASGIAENSTLTGTMIAGIQAIGIGSITPVILPLTLTEFAAVKQAGTGLLSWKTVQEQNISNYTVERSANGRSYTGIGSIASVGSPAYSLTDAAPLKGANYYRLKITERDGKTSYSDIRVLNFSSQISIAVFPNPVKDKAIVTGLEAGMMVLLVNEQGQTISRSKASGNTLIVKMNTLAASTYYIQTLNTDGRTISISKVVKE